MSDGVEKTDTFAEYLFGEAKPATVRPDGVGWRLTGTGTVVVGRTLTLSWHWERPVSGECVATRKAYIPE